MNALRYDAILTVASLDELLAGLVDFANDLGFKTADLTAFIPRPDCNREIAILDNLPRSDDWRSLPASLGSRCPVMQHCKRSSASIAWSSATYKAPGVRDIYDVISPLGLKSGVCVSLHLPAGNHLQVSLHTDQDAKPGGYASVIEHLMSFSHAAMVPASELLFKLPEAHQIQPLTKIERECLKWAADGLSYDCIANKLNISEGRAVNVLAVATSTLGCSSPQSAGLRARKLGII